MAGSLITFSFSGSLSFHRFFNYILDAARTSPDGTAVLGYSYSDNPGVPARRIALIAVADGRVLALLNRDLINVVDMAVAADRMTVAIAGKDPLTGEVGIFLGQLGTANIQLIVPVQSRVGVPQEVSVGLVPDGSAVLFSRDGQIWTYDVTTRQTSILLRAGTNPTCSPDGRWIGYNARGYAVVASRRGTDTKRASRGHIHGHVHWSPDSAYYFVNEEVPGSSPDHCPFGDCFVVYRLRDGSRLELQGTDRRDSCFGWLRLRSPSLE